MAVKKRGLGRGLDALLGSHANTSSATVTTRTQKSAEGLQSLLLAQISPGKYQPRKDMDQQSLEELAQSIRAQGIMQPIVVRAIDAQKYEIIAGERRWRAAAIAGLERIEVIIRDVPDEAVMAMALIENIQREDLNPIEEAVALQRLQEEYGLTHQELATAVGKSRATVTNLLRLLALPDEVKILVAHGDIEMGHARAVLGLPAEQQADAARYVAAEGLTVRQTEAYVRDVQKPKAEPAQKVEDPDIARLEQKLAERLGALVNIRHGSKGKGQLVIRYSSLDELQSVLTRIH